jgi:glycosyltransferase involved in cell wall biosynthesis
VPPLRSINGCTAPIVVAGADIPGSLMSSGDRTVSWHSQVDDLTPLYEGARVFVAPTRYAAGISLKVIEAAARGIPIVGTSLVAQQLGWVAGIEMMTADSPTDFAAAVALLYEDRELWLRLREAALKRVSTDYSAERFRSALHNALNFSTRSSDVGRVLPPPLTRMRS